jgi:hypothetical protein
MSDSKDPQDIPAATPTGSPSTFAGGPLSEPPSTEPAQPHEESPASGAPDAVPGGVRERVKRLFGR